MTDKSRPMFLILGGGYLVYTGCKLISEVMKSHPSNENLFIAFGAFFAIFGVVVVGVNLKKIYDDVKVEKESDTIVEEIEFPEEKAEPIVRKERRVKNHVQMIKLESDDAEELEEDVAEEEIADHEEETAENEYIEDEIIEDEAEDFFDEAEDEDFSDEDDEEFEAEDDEDLFEVKLERI